MQNFKALTRFNAPTEIFEWHIQRDSSPCAPSFAVLDLWLWAFFDIHQLWSLLLLASLSHSRLSLSLFLADLELSFSFSIRKCDFWALVSSSSVFSSLMQTWRTGSRLFQTSAVPTAVPCQSFRITTVSMQLKTMNTTSCNTTIPHKTAQYNNIVLLQAPIITFAGSSHGDVLVPYISTTHFFEGVR